MSLHLHRAERADVLVDALAEVLAAPLADPFATGEEDGVCAGVDFRSPRRLVQAALGDPGGDDAWAPSRAVWPLLATLEEALAEPWATVLAGYLGGPEGPVPAGGG